MCLHIYIQNIIRKAETSLPVHLHILIRGCEERNLIVISCYNALQNALQKCSMRYKNPMFFQQFKSKYYELSDAVKNKRS